LPDEPADPERPSIGPALQLKVRLLQVSPMVWRRLLVPAATSLRELHGVVQVAMGWEGIHLFQFRLRAVRYGSSELSAGSADVALETLRLRAGSRFVYEYDLTAPWRHEVRVEQRVEPGAGKPGPFCLAGHGDCPAHLVPLRPDHVFWDQERELRRRRTNSQRNPPVAAPREDSSSWQPSARPFASVRPTTAAR